MLYILFALAALAADQWVKYWTVSHLALGAQAPLLPGVIELLRVHNFGAAWSSFSGMRWLLVVVNCVIIGVIGYLLARKTVRHPLGRIAGTLIIAGGLGNILDRVRLGYVVDMFNFQFMNYPVFNVADICVVSGAILAAIYYLWFYEKYDKKVAR